MRKHNNLNYYCNIDGVISLLHAEAAFTSRILQKNSYEILLEMGCDLARNYNIAAMHKINYIGVDIRKYVIEILSVQMKKLNLYKNASFINDSAMNIKNICANLPTQEILCLFPFNLIGNFSISEVNNLFSMYSEKGIDIIVSGWQCSSYAFTVRSDYYKKCGINGLHFTKTDISNCLASTDFRSEAYCYNYLIQIAHQHGFTLIEEFTTSIVQLMYFRSQEVNYENQ